MLFLESTASYLDKSIDCEIVSWIFLYCNDSYQINRLNSAKRSFFCRPDITWIVLLGFVQWLVRIPMCYLLLLKSFQKIWNSFQKKADCLKQFFPKSPLLSIFILVSKVFWNFYLNFINFSLVFKSKKWKKSVLIFSINEKKWATDSAVLSQSVSASSSMELKCVRAIHSVRLVLVSDNRNKKL